MTFHHFTSILSWCFMPLILIDWIIFVHWGSRGMKGEWDFWFSPIYTVVMFLYAVDALQQKNWFGVGLFSFCCFIGAWVWWHNDKHRRKRRKMLEKGYGRVIDLGGRLKVVRPATEHG